MVPTYVGTYLKQIYNQLLKIWTTMTNRQAR